MLLQRPMRSAAAIALACLLGTNVSFVAAQLPTPGLSQLGGWVYIDRNNDGDLAFMNEPDPEFVIGNVTISLYSQTGPETLVATTQTDQFGRYFFNDLEPGTYAIKQTQPVEFVDGIDTPGQMFALTPAGIGGSVVGTALNNVFNGIVLAPNVRGEFFNFGERGLAPGYVSKRYLLGSAPDMPITPDVEIPFVPEPSTCVMMLLAAGFGLLPRRGRR